MQLSGTNFKMTKIFEIEHEVEGMMQRSYITANDEGLVSEIASYLSGEVVAVKDLTDDSEE